MALSNYTDLQAAVRAEMSDVSTSGLSATAIVDAITRTEAKINRRTRLREAEQLAYATYNASDDTIESRRIAMPLGYVEMLDLRWKKSSEDDTAYTEAMYVHPTSIHSYYTSITDSRLYYTIRDQIEFNRQTAGVDYELMMHYLKKWDIASDSTNWLLTNYPDAYLYGACVEVAAFIKNPEEAAGYKVLFDEVLKELNELSKRGRDDSQLSTAEVSGMSGSSGGYDVLVG